MHLSTYFFVTVLSALPLHVAAFPAMGSLAKRIAASGDDGVEDRQLIGDLKQGITSPTGQTIANILLGNEPGESNVAGYKPALLGTAACKADTCCVWSYVSKAMTLAFTGPTGRCNSLARAAIRLGFHDAGTWSSSLAAAGQDFGGADGSIALAPSEAGRADNAGLGPIIQQAQIWSKLFGVGVADLIQFAAKHAVVTCPLGPRTRVFVGRIDSSKASPEGLMPSVTMSTDAIIALFQDKTISPHNLTALLGAHSASQQFTVDKSKSGQSQDSTPGVWDVAFYNETLQATAPKKVFQFDSDRRLSVDSRMNDEWTAFVGDQSHWNDDYAAAYVRLSLLGVNNINNLTECTKVLPAARPTYNGASIPGLFG